MLLKGRKKITTEYTSNELKANPIDARFALISIWNTTFSNHLQNKSEIDYLQEYSKGVQPVLYREKVIRDDVLNNLVLNHAQMITRNINGYFLGTPIQYIQNGNKNSKDFIDLLNRYVAYEDKASVDKEIGDFQSVCGTAYRIIYTDGLLADEVPFEDKSLDPATTYVVYENTIAEKPVVGITYHNMYKEDGSFKGYKLYFYTDFGVYIFITDEHNELDETSPYVFEPYNVGGVPIIEYPNNMWRIGDWELCIGLMDAINNLNSGRLDDIDQIIQSLLVFINAEIDADGYDEMREKGVVLLKNTTGLASDVKTVNNALDQGGMHLFAEEMESLLYALIGIPDRNNRSGGGGDTGQAVELRDGWADLEIIARNKELVYKKAEKQTLKIILTMVGNTGGFKLSPMDVDIKFTRNKNNNLLVKSQSYSTLLATKTLSPADCLTIVDLVSDVDEYITRGEAFWKDQFGGAEPEVPKPNDPLKKASTNGSEGQ